MCVCGGVGGGGIGVAWVLGKLGVEKEVADCRPEGLEENERAFWQKHFQKGSFSFSL